MPHFVSTKEEIMENTNDITSDFACLKVSALKKASRISGEVDRITIGPDSMVNENECNETSENIENEQNSCNTSVPNKSIQSQNNKTSMQSGITFSVKKILLESEYQRKEEVQKEIERHWQHMKENGKAIKEHMAISRSHMAKERERKSKENYAYILAEERIAEQEEIRRRHEQQKEVEEYRRKMKEKEELTKKIMNLRNICGMKYRDIAALSETCKDKNSATVALSSYVPKLEEVHHQIELIDEKIKVGEVTLVDLNTIEKMITQVDEILLTFKLEIERINVQYEVNLTKLQNTTQSYVQPQDLQKQVSESTQPVCEIITSEQINSNNVQTNEGKYVEKEKENTQVQNISCPNPPETTQNVVSTEESLTTTEQEESQLYEYVDKESLQLYVNSQKFLENYVKMLDEFSQSANTKKFRFECKKAINIPVNAISGISEQHLRDKYESLHNLLIGKSSPNVNQYAQGAAFCKNILAKQIVNQGETLVSSKPKMAFPVAAVVVALWNDHSDFGELLLSYFHNVCPFTVPIFMPKMVGQSNESYYKLMGYKYAEDGTVEKHDKYLKRMSGVIRLYASITITSQRKGVVKSNPHGLQSAWRWLAAILNTEPRKEVADLRATLLLDMLEVAGSALWAAYPKQFHKLLILLLEEYYPRMQRVGCIGGGPLVRLEEFLRNTLAKGSIAPPEGQLPSNFW